MASPRILNVGQCGFDHRSIASYLQQAFRAEVAGADTATEAIDALQSGHFDLVLVNRIGDEDGAPGLDLIRALKTDPDLAGLPVMLVSNYAEAQEEAVALGALLGFGKGSLRDPSTRERLEQVLVTPS